MKEKLKSLIPKMIVVIVIFGLFCFGVGIFLAGGCKIIKELEIHEDGYFQYVIVGENSRNPDKDNSAVVAVVGFTESGKQQEIIEFPREINGIPVQYIGYRDYRTFQESFYHLESTNLKKIYVHDNIKSVCREAFWYFGENEQDLEIMICVPRSPYRIFAEHNYGKFYIYKSLFDSGSFNDNVHWGNIVFINNYSEEINGGYYRLDNISAGEKIPVPFTEPERNGYEFIGWYTEPECINKWDFETSPVIEEDAEFRLYAGWRSI